MIRHLVRHLRGRAPSREAGARLSTPAEVQTFRQAKAAIDPAWHRLGGFGLDTGDDRADVAFIELDGCTRRVVVWARGKTR